MKKWIYFWSVCLVFIGCKKRSSEDLEESALTGTKGKVLYVDMDGVLSDFIGEYKARAKDDFESHDKNWQKINKWGEDFWSEMRWMPDGKKLWHQLEKYQPIILTSCGREPSIGCESGKKKWVKKNLGPNYKIILRYDKEFYAKSNAILIDDMLKYLDPWTANGGIGIHHFNADDSLKALHELMERKQ